MYSNSDAEQAPEPVALTKASNEAAQELEIMFLSRGGSLVFDEFAGQHEQVWMVVLADWGGSMIKMIVL